MIPIEDVQTTHHGSLRVTPTLNGQQKGVRLAAAYEIARVELV